VRGTVYAICAGDAVKIGVTKNSVESRLAELQTGNSHPLGIAAQYTPIHLDAYAVERMAHAYLLADRIRGEWFTPTREVRRIIYLMRQGCLEGFLDPEIGLDEADPIYPADVDDPLADIPVRILLTQREEAKRNGAVTLVSEAESL